MSAARKQRRAWQRRRTRELRAAGCTCVPTVTPMSSDHWTDEAKERGAVAGELVLHERGCPLGAAVTLANRLGITPSIWSVAGSECAR